MHFLGLKIILLNYLGQNGAGGGQLKVSTLAHYFNATEAVAKGWFGIPCYSVCRLLYNNEC